MKSILSSRWNLPGLVALLCTVIVGCGGGHDGEAAINTMSASGVAFGRLMTVAANGSGLEDPGLVMTVDGPCTSIARTPGGADFQAVFTCTVTGTGEIIAYVRKAGGDELARLRVVVPAPQVSMAVQSASFSGTIVVELDPTAAPRSVRNFLAYVNSGFYANTLFHRVVAGKIAQAGGYVTGPEPELKAVTFAPIALESNNGLSNKRGTIAMARTLLPDSATSQFYFNVSDNPELDYRNVQEPGYAVFGHVVSGLPLLDQIGAVQTRGVSISLQSVPVADITITAIAQTR